MQDLTDEQLVARCQAAEKSADSEPFLAELFQRHSARVSSWCYQMTGDVSTAADLAQETFIKAFRALHTFRSGSRFTTWLYSIARNHCLDELRARSRSREELSDTLPEEVADLGLESADSAIEQRQTAELMNRLIRESLDEIEARVMTMHYVHELPLDAITRMLKLSNTSGAKAYVVSARRKLKRAYELWTRRNRGAKAGRYGE